MVGNNIVLYVSDLAPSDHHLFLQLRKQLDGQCNDTDDDVKTAVM